MAKLRGPKQARERIKELEAEVAKIAERRYRFAGECDFDEAVKCRDEERKILGEIFKLVVKHCL